MRHPIKIILQKKFAINANWNRYRTVDRLLIDGINGITTEAQLCYYIYSRFGEGRYMCLAFQKGYEGFWNFWIGNVMANGYIRDFKKNKELEKIKRQLYDKNKSYEEKEELEYELDSEREISQLTKGGTRRGPIGLKKTRPGMMHSYEEI